MQLRENPARIAYLAATLAVAVVAWLGLSALTSPFVQVDLPSPGIVAQNIREGAGSNLPLRYAAQIQKLPGALDVGWMNFEPLNCKPTVAVTLNAWGGPGARRALADVGISAAQEAAFNADPLGVLVGDTLASQCGWRAGMSAQPPDPYGRPTEVHIVGVYHSGKSWGGGIAYAHYDYLNRNLPPLQRDRAQYITAYARHPADDPHLAASIQAFFAHSDPPVEAHVDSGTQNALARFGNVQLLLAFVMFAVLSCTALVLISVWAHAAAQRRPQMATLQALGFQRRVLFAGSVLEALLVALIGVAIGITFGVALIHALAPQVAPILGTFVSPSMAYALLPLWLLPLLVAALIAPGYIAMRTRPIDARRH